MRIRRDTLLRFGRSMIVPAIMILLGWYVSENWYQISLVRGDSMAPAYHDMQLVVTDRRSENGYTYGDVIIFECPGLDAVLMKRIAACPGDQVLIQNAGLYVNGVESIVFPKQYEFAYAGIAGESLYLGERQYFVIGDNLAESKDSRYAEVGTVDAERIIGKVVRSGRKP